MQSLDEIQRAYDAGTKVGEGVYGVTKLVKTRTGKQLIFKYFGKNYDTLQQQYDDAVKQKIDVRRLHQLYMLVEEARNDAIEEKKREEQRHIAAYIALAKRGRAHVVCEPFRSVHPMITMQRAANTSDEGAMPLNKFMDGVKKGNLKIKRSNSAAKRSGTSVNMNVPAVSTALGKLKAEASSALHSVGVYHGDLKEDNIMVVFPLRNATIENIKLKIIDFGLAEVNSKRLVTVDAFSGEMNTRRLMKLNNRVSRRFAHNKDSIFGDIGLYGINGHTGARRSYMRNIARKYATPAYLARAFRNNARAAASKITRAAAKSAPAQRTRRTLGLPAAPSLRLADIDQLFRQTQSGGSQKFRNAIARIALSKISRPPPPPRRNMIQSLLERTSPRASPKRSSPRTSPRASPKRSSPRTSPKRSSPRTSLQSRVENKGSTSRNKGSTSRNSLGSRMSRRLFSAFRKSSKVMNVPKTSAEYRIRI